MEKSIKERLIECAKEESKRSYSPYSEFSVGAALLCSDGEIYRGTNVENKSYGATCCAERTAFFSAIADGKREFSAIAVYADKNPCYPCGICRQVMAEFANDDFEIILYNGKDVKIYTLSELLPAGFNKNNLK